MGLVLAEVFWSIGMITFESFMPLRLEEMVGSAQEAGALVGPVSAAGWGLFSVGAWLAGHDVGRIGVARAAVVGRVLNALGAVVMGLVMGPVGLIVAYLFTYSMHGLNGPPHEALLHREAEASNRSTVLSINSMMAFLAFGVAGPLFGLMADRTSLGTAMVTAGALSILGAFFYLPARRKEAVNATARASWRPLGPRGWDAVADEDTSSSGSARPSPSSSSGCSSCSWSSGHEAVARSRCPRRRHPARLPSSPTT